MLSLRSFSVLFALNKTIGLFYKREDKRPGGKGENQKVWHLRRKGESVGDLKEIF